MDGPNTQGNAQDADEPQYTGIVTKRDEWILSGDGLKIFVRRWIPLELDKPRALLHIVHGMAEHSLRYERLACRLCQAGIEVWAADQRGHGKTADLRINDPDKGGLLGHCADKDGHIKVTADIDLINRRITTIYPEAPLFLLGHSWGSFLVQNYIETYTYPLAGCILSGTRGPDGLKIKIAVPVMAMLALCKGPRKGSVLARALADGPFSKPFKPNRTPFDWLSRDEHEVDAYVADPLSGNLCSVGFYRDLSVLLYRIHKPEAIHGIRRDVPIYVFSGNTDPVGDMGDSPTALVNAYRSIGVKDLEFVLYPDARHETLNETNRAEVTENLLDWITRHCSGNEFR
ncbi:MAG: lysophospholipase [Treponema sp.]|jgi:alpha-beta hydrolase superfamily lysophospholipase|nr:lysophospholipase [Treponema sp.]